VGAEANQAIIRRLIEEVINEGKLELIDDLFTPTFVDRSSPDQPPGPEGVRDYIAAARIGFPDLRVHITDLLAKYNKVAVRTLWRGTHMGVYDGKAPTGKLAMRTMIQIFRLVNGKIVDEWNEGGDFL